MAIITVDDKAMQEQGYVKAEQYKNVTITVHAAARIIGISHATLRSNIISGLIPTNEEGRVRLSDALKVPRKQKRL